MPSAKYPNMTAEQLQQLFQEHGTWEAVAQHLGISKSGLNGLKKRLGVSGVQKNRHKKRDSILDPYAKDITELNGQGYNCHEIREALQLPVEAEQVRRWLHKHGVKLAAKQGAQPGKKHRDWKGGRLTARFGYILVFKPDHPNARKSGYIFEHRLVMAEHLGRPLKANEVVHHKNGIVSDNRIDNLELFQSNGKHLAATLKGQVPKWTQAGMEKIRNANRKKDVSNRQRDEKGKFTKPE